MNTKSTEELMNVLINTDNTTTLETVLIETEDAKASFSEMVNRMLTEQNMTPADLQRKSGIARTYIYQILDGTRNPGRDKVIAVALALKADIDVTQRMLKVTGNAVLYPKDKRDAVIIFAVNKKMTVIDVNNLLESNGAGILE